MVEVFVAVRLGVPKVRNELIDLLALVHTLYAVAHLDHVLQQNHNHRELFI